MTTACPNGHESEWADWCSVCGERLADAGEAAAGTAPQAAPAATAPPAETVPRVETAPSVATSPAAAGPTCENCGVSRHELDVFCESCGYDFASGSLPEGALDQPGDANQPAATPMHVKVSVDPEFFAATIGDVDLALPDPVPEQKIVPLAGGRILIGRTSSSRGIFPEIDVRALTDDPAVSSRHVMLERDANDNWTLTDLGSTNGTFLTAVADDAIEAGEALPVTPGTSIYLGAWTRLDLATSL